MEQRWSCRIDLRICKGVERAVKLITDTSETVYEQ